LIVRPLRENAPDIAIVLSVSGWNPEFVKLQKNALRWLLRES
jgi:hypothetical protein